MVPAQRRSASPAKEPLDSTSATDKSMPSPPNPIRVLIIDDDDDELVLITRSLAGMNGFTAEVHQASSLARAQALIEEHLFDVALVDFDLGDHKGAHVIGELGGRGSEIALILLIGQGDGGTKRRALDAGALQIVGKKSLDAEILENAIHSSLLAQESETKLNDALVELERATRSRADFFAKIGHDLKTPLNSVIGYSDAIAGELFGPHTNPKYREYAQAVGEAGTHLLELIQNLIHFSLGEIQNISFTRNDLRELAASALRMTELQCQKRGHTLIKQFADKPVHVDCQASAITQTIINLLTNAIKYTTENGRIEVTVRKTGHHAEVEIKDNGIGMSQTDLSVALQPFGRVQLPADKAQEGTGLGLHIVREIMARHRGQLDVSSAPGKGTTAILRLPIHRNEKKKSKS